MPNNGDTDEYEDGPEPELEPPCIAATIGLQKDAEIDGPAKLVVVLVGVGWEGT